MRPSSRRRVCATIEAMLFKGAPMSTDLLSSASETADNEELGANVTRREQLVTVAATSLAVLVVAAIAVLMGMA